MNALPFIFFFSFSFSNFVLSKILLFAFFNNFHFFLFVLIYGWVKALWLVKGGKLGILEFLFLVH